MADYLVTPNHLLTLGQSTYATKWRVVASQHTQLVSPPSGGLYIDKPALHLDRTVPHSGQQQNDPTGADQFYSISDPANFDAFFKDWNASGATLQRAMVGCHRRWPDLLVGTLRSEGVADTPTFTMGNAVGTAWLPCGFYNQNASPDASIGIALGCLDQFTQAAISSSTNLLPVGVIVTVTSARNSSAATCWLNSGEVVVRGPLTSPAYQVWRIVYLSKIIHFAKALPPEVNLNALPQRPYKPESQEPIQAWLVHALSFVASVLQHTTLP